MRLGESIATLGESGERLGESGVMIWGKIELWGQWQILAVVDLTSNSNILDHF